MDDIDGGTVLLNGLIPAYLGKEGWAKSEANSSNIKDHDGDGVLERMVKFDRDAVGATLTEGDPVVVTVTGLAAAADFEGFDEIRVMSNKAPDNDTGQEAGDDEDSEAGEKGKGKSKKKK